MPAQRVVDMSNSPLDHNDKKLSIIIWVGGAAILAITFGKLLWVTYFRSMRLNDAEQLSDMVLETIPLFALAVGIGLVVAWIRNKGGSD